MPNKFDLKGFRENSLKMTQTELANLLGVRQDAISRWEKNPDMIALNDLILIASRTGLTLDQLVSYKKDMPEPLEVENTWRCANYVKNTMVDYISSNNYFKGDYEDKVSTLNNIVKQSVKKPKVVFLGRSDSGKSTMINALIGQNKMPTEWTPTTSIVVYIKHIKDRPEYIKDELWIFKKGEDDDFWDDSRLEDEQYCNGWKIASGNAEMLSAYGTRHGGNYNENSIGSAVLFIDSDILNDCDILDVPGFTGGVESDNKAAYDIQSKADILVYLSQAGGGFLGAEDCVYLKEAINNLTVVENKDNGISPLGNLFVVASHAHVVENGNPNTLNRIKNDGADRFYNTLTPHYWDRRSKISGLHYTISDIKKRFFSYTIDIPEVRREFEVDLKSIIELLPKLIMEKTISSIKEYSKMVEIQLDEQIETYRGLVEKREQYQKALDEIKKNEYTRKAETIENKEEILDDIRKYNKTSQKEFEEKYNKIIDIDHIITVIDEKGYHNKKEDMQFLSSYLNSEIEDAYKDILEEDSWELSKKINRYIAAFENKNRFCHINSADVNINGFLAKRAFASGLAGAGVFGGLAFWASTLGNLGGYILVAKGVSLLSALGISVGGTAAAISAVAAIGGPVTIAIGLAIVAALGVFAIFTGGWKNKIARKVIDAYNEQNALSKYKDTIEKFWNDTKIAFEKASKNMENEWDKYIKNFEDQLNKQNADELERSIELAQKLKSFFSNIPF